VRIDAVGRTAEGLTAADFSVRGGGL